MPGNVFVVDHGLDHKEVLGRDQPHLLTFELAVGGSAEHLVVEVDAAGRLEDDVDEDVVAECLEQPVGIRLLGGEPRRFEDVEGGAGVLGADEEVDVVRPPRPPHGSRAHPAHQDVLDVARLDGGDRMAEDAQKPVVLFVAGFGGGLLHRIEIGTRRRG